MKPGFQRVRTLSIPGFMACGGAAAGLPPAFVIGTRNALEPGRSVPVRSALIGAVAAVTAVVSAVVFNASLAGLVSHPARYGWNWDTVIQAEAGYGSFDPGVMSKLLGGRRPPRARPCRAVTRSSRAR